MKDTKTVPVWAVKGLIRSVQSQMDNDVKRLLRLKRRKSLNVKLMIQIKQRITEASWFGPMLYQLIENPEFYRH